VRLVCGYDPYLRSIGVPQGGVAEAADPQRFEYYYVGGDRIGPRIVRKALEARMYRDQTVTLLEGSRFLQRSMDALLSDAKPIPRGALSARGGTDSVELEGEEDERFLRIHERRAPRPPARKESTNLRARVLRFLGR